MNNDEEGTNMKRLIAFASAAALGLGLAACDSPEEEIVEEDAEMLEEQADMLEDEAEMLEDEGMMAEADAMEAEAEAMEDAAEGDAMAEEPAM